MKRMSILCLAMLLCSTLAFSQAQNKLVARQKKQEQVIKAARKKGKVTDNEYAKLMDEQETIKRYIRAAEADGVWTSKELNGLNGKLERAAKRLKRYQHNNELY